MSEYISRDAALRDWPLCDEPADAYQFIRHYPSADVRPVVRGKWIPDYDYTEYDYDGSTPLPEPRKFQDGWKCSLCGAYEPSTVNFCPNCGAKMRSTNCTQTTTADEEREVLNVRAWLRNGADMRREGEADV